MKISEQHRHDHQPRTERFTEDVATNQVHSCGPTPSTFNETNALHCDFPRYSNTIAQRDAGAATLASRSA